MHLGSGRCLELPQRASEVGAVEWVNAFRSGDYAGRAIWTPLHRGFPIAVVGPAGRVEAERTADRTEFCPGADAHTHYCQLS